MASPIRPYSLSDGWKLEYPTGHDSFFVYSVWGNLTGDFGLYGEKGCLPVRIPEDDDDVKQSGVGSGEEQHFSFTRPEERVFIYSLEYT
jgi:hypothetical protein